MAIARYKIWSSGEKFTLGGVTGARHIALQAVAKHSTPQHPSVLINEVICSELGRSLGLPVPPYAIIEDDASEAYFVSLDFNLAGEALPPADANAFVSVLPELAWGVILFDSWVINTDRHNGNIAFLQGTSGVQLFDHSHAIYGDGPAGLTHFANFAEDPALANDCLAKVVASLDGFAVWKRRIQALPEYMIDQALESAVSVGLSPSLVVPTRTFLLARRSNLETLLRGHPTSLPALDPNLWTSLGGTS